VVVVGQGAFAGIPYSFYDLLRMSNGKIAEHWDVLEAQTPAAQAKNQNRQFNFPRDPLT
jgi:predicted SnoaL-like aldol condensation-catalyzing enzyme